LLEVLVVIATLVLFCVVMAAMALRTSSKNSHRACASNVRELGTAVVMYAQDHDDTLLSYTNIELVIAHTDRQQRGSTPPTQPELIKKALNIYVPSNETWFCPSDPAAKQPVYYLGIKHDVTSYAFPLYLSNSGQPRRLSSLSNDYTSALVWDAAGDRSMCSPGVWYGGAASWASNHPDGMVNFVLPDLSVRQVPGKWGSHGLMP